MPKNIKHVFLTKTLHLILPWFLLAFYSCSLRSASSIHVKVLSVLTTTAFQCSPEVRGLGERMAAETNNFSFCCHNLKAKIKIPSKPTGTPTQKSSGNIFGHWIPLMFNWVKIQLVLFFIIWVRFWFCKKQGWSHSCLISLRLEILIRSMLILAWT